MPKGFPTERHDAIKDQVVAAVTVPGPIWNQFAPAWNGVAYRYHNAVECSSRFGASLDTFGASPPAAERAAQERDLLGFFVSGVALFDHFAYAVYALGAHVNAGEFPIASASDLKGITIRSTARAFSRAFVAEPLTCALAILGWADMDFDDMLATRNVLAHRGPPPRGFVRGGDKDREALWLRAIGIGDHTTAGPLGAVSITLSVLLDSATSFVTNHL